MDWKNYVDVSSSILFEAAADSEADSDINKDMDNALLSEDTGFADDDALSCSFDDIDQYCSTADDFETDPDQEEEEEGILEDDDCRIFYCDDDLEEGVVDQLWNGNDKAKDLKPTGGATSSGVLMDERQRKKKLKVCAEEFMNQRDKDRRFWETCLAS